jgi:hypothetical protein
MTRLRGGMVLGGGCSCRGDLVRRTKKQVCRRNSCESGAESG